MSYGTAFPKTFALTLLDESDIWQLEFTEESTNDIQSFINYVEHQFAKYRDFEPVKLISNSLYDDLIECAANNTKFARICQFLKFYISTRQADYYLKRKVKEYVREWIEKALDNSIDADPNEKSDFDRLIGISNYPNEYIQLSIFPTIGTWIASIFYYGWWIDPDYLMMEGFVEQAEKIFIEFFEISDNSPLLQNILHIVPDGMTGVMYFSSKFGFINPYNESNLFKELLEAKIAFLQLDNPDPTHNGVPAVNEGLHYEAILKDHFHINDLAKSMPVWPGYFVHDEGNHPIQAVMIKELNDFLPLAASFTASEPERLLKKALIWHDASVMSTTEAEGIKQIFANNNITYTELLGDANTVDDFKDAYQSNEFDYVHVSSHGVFSYSEPHFSNIQLAWDKQLTLQELGEYEVSWRDRRLLFLNICDGATTSLLNSPASIGFSPILVSPKQSLISHLWPVNQRVAMIYGWLITSHLAKGYNYAQSFKCTIQLMQKGKEEIYLFLKNSFLGDDLLMHIENLDFDLTNLVHSGSLAFMI